MELGLGLGLELEPDEGGSDNFFFFAVAVVDVTTDVAATFSLLNGPSSSQRWSAFFHAFSVPANARLDPLFLAFGVNG